MDGRELPKNKRSVYQYGGKTQNISAAGRAGPLAGPSRPVFASGGRGKKADPAEVGTDGGTGLLAVYLSRTEAPSMGFIGLVLLVAAVILISPVAERRNLMGEQYWITNQRAILMTRDKTFFYMELSDIDDLQVVGGTTKGKSLVLGRCLFEEAKKLLRWRACHPKVDVQSHDETDRALGMIFYGVQGAEAAAELLRQGRDGEAA